MIRLISSCLLLTLLVSFFPAPLMAADGSVKTANYYLLSGSRLDDAIETLSSFDLLVLPAEAQVYNASFFSRIREKHPGIIILAYVPTVSWNFLYWTDPLHDVQKQGIRESDWLETGNGGRVSVWENTQALNVNSGWADELASFVQTDIYATGLWDGIFFDEVQDSISWVGATDTDQNGLPDDPGTADANWERGYTRLFSAARANLGGNAIILTNGSSKSSYAPYVNGRMFESFPSSGSSLNSWVGSAREYLAYEKKTGYANTNIVNVNTDNTGTQTDYRKMRFGLATTLLGDGYFSFDYGTLDHAQTWVYDEYEAHLGEPKGPIKNLLSRETTTLNQGVWARDYVRGKVVVNSTDATQTVRLDGEYEKLHGTQDPATNNGNIVSRLTLPSEDGIVLLRPIEAITDATFINGAFARIFNGDGSVKRNGFFSYDPLGQGNNRVVTQDIDGDGTKETIVANLTYVSIYKDGVLKKQFAPYTEAYKQGVNIAVGDLENDGSFEIITGTENGGGPQVRIFNFEGNLIHPGFFAYGTDFRGGVNVTLGDLDGNGTKEIIAGAGVGGGPQVRIFNKDGRLINPGFFAYDPLFRGGVNVACGDVDGDGIDDIVTGPGKGGGPHVKVFTKDGVQKSQFFTGDTTSADGTEVAAADLDGDGLAEVVGFSTNVFTLSFR